MAKVAQRGCGALPPGKCIALSAAHPDFYRGWPL